MAKTGRPRALDDTKRSEICALVSAGYGIEKAADYVGCAPSTVRREALRNPDFHDRMRKAQLTAELDPLRSVRNKAQTHWRAAAWLLERIDPTRFAKRNPKLFTPDQVEELFDSFIEKLIAAVDDNATGAGLYQQILEFTKQIATEAFSSSKPLRDPRRARRMMKSSATKDDGSEAQADAKPSAVKEELNRSKQR